MRTKILTLFLALITGAGTLFANGVQIGNLYYILDADNMTAQVTYKSVDSYYNYNKNWYIKSANIPESVTYEGTSYNVISIGEYAFASCDSLTQIEIPNSVTEIKEYAFRGCDFCSIELPQNITTIANSTFSACVYLTTITIPNNVTSIGKYAFYACESLEHIEIPDHVRNIGDGAFKHCRKLVSMIIPNSVLAIGAEAFWDCDSLNVVTLGEGVISIGAQAFQGCKKLSQIEIPNSVQTISTGAFRSCNNLAKVRIGENISYIGDYSFEGCTKCSSITVLSETPSNIGTREVFPNTNIYVPCNSMKVYKETWRVYAYNIKYAPPVYSVTGKTNINGAGIIKIPLTECEDTITAIPNYGYHFIQWSDGVTNNPRVIELSQDTSFTAEFAPNEYVIITESSNPEYGVSIGDTSVQYLEQVNISATANYGYHFEKWQDGNTENPRLITVTKDAKYTAIFEKNTYSISKYTDYAKGYIDGPSNAKYLDIVTLYANPRFGYHFTQWSDSINDNPRTFVITQDTTFTAEFELTTSGQCGDNLYWTYNNNVLTISGSGDMYNYDNYYNPVPWKLFVNEVENVVFASEMTSIGNYACANMANLEHINIPASVQTIGNYAFANINNRAISNIVLPSDIVTIGDYAFAGNTYIEQIDFGKSMEYIGAYAFQNCSRVTTMTCLAEVTPNVGTDALASISNYAELYVLSSAIRKYQVDANWNRFLLKEIGAEETAMKQNDVIIVPADNSATITWPISASADTYTIEITKDGEIFCILTFNADGQLAGIAFTPNRNGIHHTPAATKTANGLQFTITGLNSATQYGYHVTAKNGSNVVASYTGVFTTSGQDVETGIVEQHDLQIQCTKIMKDGQIYIMRGEKIYNLQGSLIK